MGESKTRKIITLGIMLLFLGMTISSSVGFNLEKQSIKPISSGNILYVGGNGTGNYSKIQDAINDASDGDTVFVYDDSSPYHEKVIINKSIELIGENKETTCIKKSVDGSVVAVTANGVTFSNFNITNSANDEGIRINSNNNIISNIIINDRAGNAIIISGGDSNVIENNYLYLHASAGVGIYLHGGYKNTIKSNFIGGFFACIKVEGCNDGRQNTIIDNTINCSNSYSGARFGILIDGSKRFEISGNIISESNDSDGAAIKIWSGFHNIHHNIIKSNKFGIYMRGAALNHHNTFLDNEYDAYFEMHLKYLFMNKWYRNYWGESLQLPKSIIGKIRIRSIVNFPFYQWIEWKQFDFFPAQEPYDIGV